MAGFYDTIRQEASSAKTCEELDVILRSLLQVGENNMATRMISDMSLLHKAISQNDTFLARPESRVSVVDAVGLHFRAHKPSDVSMNFSKRAIEDIVSHIELDAFHDPSLTANFATQYQQAKQEYVAGRDRTLAEKVGSELCSLSDAQMVSQNIDKAFKDVDISTLRNAYEKMESEHSFGHKNSREYEEMRSALKAVCDMEPNDPRMQNALGELYTKSNAYAQKNAFSTKKTPLGIQRKNTALLLMSLSDPHQTKAVLEQRTPEDLRLKTFKKKTDFNSLMAEEKKRNERKYSKKAAAREVNRQLDKAKKEVLGAAQPKAPGM